MSEDCAIGRSSVAVVASITSYMEYAILLLLLCRVNLDKVFTNPCRGMLKQLKIDYISRGFSGSIRVRERKDLLVATIV